MNVGQICLSRPQVERVTTPSERQSQGGATAAKDQGATGMHYSGDESRQADILLGAMEKVQSFFQVESVPGSHLTCLSTDVRALAMKLQQLMLGT